MALSEAEREFLKLVYATFVDPFYDEEVAGVFSAWINSEHGDLLAAKLAYDKEKGV